MEGAAGSKREGSRNHNSVLEEKDAFLGEKKVTNGIEKVVFFCHP